MCACVCVCTCERECVCAHVRESVCVCGGGAIMNTLKLNAAMPFPCLWSPLGLDWHQDEIPSPYSVAHKAPPGRS